MLWFLDIPADKDTLLAQEVSRATLDRRAHHSKPDTHYWKHCHLGEGEGWAILMKLAGPVERRSISMEFQREGERAEAN